MESDSLRHLQRLFKLHKTNFVSSRDVTRKVGSLREGVTCQKWNEHDEIIKIANFETTAAYA